MGSTGEKLQQCKGSGRYQYQQNGEPEDSNQNRDLARKIGLDLALVIKNVLLARPFPVLNIVKH